MDNIENKKQKSEDFAYSESFTLSNYAFKGNCISLLFVQVKDKEHQVLSYYDP